MAQLRIDLDEATLRELTVTDEGDAHTVDLVISGTTTDFDADELQDPRATLRPVSVTFETDEE